MLVLLTVC